MAPKRSVAPPSRVCKIHLKKPETPGGHVCSKQSREAGSESNRKLKHSRCRVEECSKQSQGPGYSHYCKLHFKEKFPESAVEENRLRKNPKCRVEECSQQSQGSRCKNYCLLHFKEKFPKAAADMHGGRTSGACCTYCGPPVLAQRTLQETGLRYCKPCHRALVSTGRTNPQCFICCAALELTEPITRPCTETATCRNVVTLCSECSATENRAPCSLCYAKHYRGGCLHCNGRLQPQGVKPPSGRRCATCFASAQKLAEGAEVDCTVCCAPCPAAAVLQCRGATCLARGRPGQICMCQFCLAACSGRSNFEVLCLSCWMSAHGDICFVCATAEVRTDWRQPLCWICATVVRQKLATTAMRI